MIGRQTALAIICMLTTLWQACGQSSTPSDKILVFHKTAGFVHKSIPAGVRAVQELARENGFAVEATDDASIFKKLNNQPFSSTFKTAAALSASMRQLIRNTTGPGTTNWSAHILRVTLSLKRQRLS
jgi:hypothetical protein